MNMEKKQEAKAVGFGFDPAFMDSITVILEDGTTIPYTDLSMPTERRVCSNTLIPFIKEQETKKRQQMKKEKRK